MFWRDLGVVNLASGRPTMRLTGGARRRLDEITPAGMVARLDVTLTDEPPLAQAVVIITAVAGLGRLTAENLRRRGRLLPRRA